MAAATSRGAQRVVAGLRRWLPAVVLAIAALVPASRGWQAAALGALLLALGEVGLAGARWLLPEAGRLPRAVAAFALAAAFASLLVTALGVGGWLARGPFLLSVAVASVLVALRPTPAAPAHPAAAPSREAQPGAARPRALDLLGWRRSLAIAALLLVAAVWAAGAWQTFLTSPHGPDDLSYHLPAAVVWSRHGDLRMLRFAMGDWSTVFYPLLPELGTWTLLAPFGDSDVAARWSALPWAIGSLVALAALGRRLGLSRSGALLAVVGYASVRRVLPLAFTAGNDHVTTFCTLAALDAALGAARAPGARRFAYLGVCLGLLAATKYIGLLYVATVLLVLLFALVAQRRRLPSLPVVGGWLALAVGCALLVGGYSYLRNAVTMGNPVYPLPISIAGRTLPGIEQATLAVRLRGPDAAIDVTDFLLRRPDLLGSFFTRALLPAALLAPLVALARRRWLHALVLTLPVALFLQFLFLMHDHRDVRYILASVALAAVALAWMLERLGRWGSYGAVVALVFVIAKQTRWLELASAVEVAIAAAAVALGLALGRRRAARLGWCARGWLPLAAAAAVAATLHASAGAYHRQRFADLPAARALEELVGARGAVVAYVGYNTPYAYFGARLQNDLRVIPRHGNLAHEHYGWGVAIGHPRPGSYSRWRRALEGRGVRYVVVIRGAAENPEHRWMARRAGRGFDRVHAGDGVEIWRVDAVIRGRTRPPAPAAAPSPS